MNILDLAELFPEAILMDGYDDCIVGVLEDQSVVVYSKDKVINKLISESEMSRVEAIEFFNFNMAGSYFGETTPVFMTNID